MFPQDTKILVVDDMMTMRKLVRRALTELGFSDIHDADNGATAWDKLKSPEHAAKPFQLVISDWNMPVQTGLDLLRSVRGDEKFRNLPFMLVTAESEASQVKAAIELKVSAYLVKPFTPAQLGERLAVVHKQSLEKRAA